MAPQVQTREVRRFGIVYPDGKTGLKIMGSQTQGPVKTVNQDGSISYSTPPPTIYELVGGGFSYADGSPVRNRAHLETLPKNMRERALAWFDAKGELSPIATEGVPELDLDKKERPKPIFMLSSDLPTDQSAVPEKVDKVVAKQSESDKLSQILSTVTSIAETVKEHGRQIVELKKTPPAPRRMALSAAKHGKQAESMKAKWADPEYRARQMASRKKKADDGQGTPEGNKEMQAV